MLVGATGMALLALAAFSAIGTQTHAETPPAARPSAHSAPAGQASR